MGEKEAPFKENEWRTHGGAKEVDPVEKRRVSYVSVGGRKWYSFTLSLPFSEMKAIDETFSLDRWYRNLHLRNLLRKACGLSELEHFNADPLSRYLKALRVRHNNISQRELAEKTGVNQAYLSNAERGTLHKEPLIGHLKSLAEFDGISLLELMRIAGIITDEAEGE
jgi:transcriptional regulator with XRE-family HTH domain